MDYDYFWSLVRKQEKKMRKCLRCDVEFMSQDARLCGGCNDINKKISITATINPCRLKYQKSLE